MSELTLLDACNETRKFARTLKGLERLAEIADALSGADQLIAERTRQAEILAGEISKAQAALATINAGIEQSRDAALNVAAEAAQKAADVISDARAQAEKLLSDANAELERVKGEANALAARAKIEGDRLTAAEAEHNTLLGKIEMARGEARKIIGE